MPRPLRMLAALTILVTGTMAPAQTGTNGSGVLVVAGGAGDEGQLLDNIRAAAAAARLPLRVERWQGTNVLVSNSRSHWQHQDPGRKLAERVAELRKSHDKVYLLGYSSGACLVLQAAERLPGGMVDRLVLLGPGVSHRYDLRAALARLPEGIDHFYSDDDALLEGLGTLLGTNDGGPAPPAGCRGFTPRVGSSADNDLYRKLRQYSYREPRELLGHKSGHLGYVRVSFLYNYVAPLLATSLRQRR